MLNKTILKRKKIKASKTEVKMKKIAMSKDSVEFYEYTMKTARKDLDKIMKLGSTCDCEKFNYGTRIGTEGRYELFVTFGEKEKTVRTFEELELGYMYAKILEKVINGFQEFAEGVEKAS